MADHDDELEERFRSLEGVPVPAWRDRVQASDADEVRLDPDSDGRSGWSRRSGLVLVGLAAVAALVIGVVAWPSDDEEQLATGAVNFGDLPPSDASLLCPPALLDVGDLFDAVTPPPEVVDLSRPPELASQPVAPTSYALRWVQNGREVVLAYPGPMIRVGIQSPSEEVALPDGRLAHLEYSSNVSADAAGPGADESTYVSADVARPGTNPSDIDAGHESVCQGFWISVNGDPDSDTIYPATGVPEPTDPNRALLVDIAATVQLRAPGGTVEVPDVEGLRSVVAQDILARGGLVPTGDGLVCCDLGDPSLVVEQSPSAGETVPIGDPVSLRVEPEG